MSKHLNELASAYHRGLLVPFLGAGMSRDVCPGWKEFVARLEAKADAAVLHAKPDGSEVAISSLKFDYERGRSGFADDLTARAARAVRRIRLCSSEPLADAVKGVLSKTPAIAPAQTEALARIHWPLVLTTNYDDLFTAAAHRASLADRSVPSGDRDAEPPLVVLGRSRSDCQRVLTSLRQPDVPILWALQGYVGGVSAGFRKHDSAWDKATTYQSVNLDVAKDSTRTKELRQQLVVGHAEYRRVALSEQHFRRAFAEVFRSRSLLFLGAGLQDRYLLDLFSEVIELYGPGPYPHFAVMLENETAPDFLRDYYGIRIDEIKDHKELPDWLESLKKGISRPAFRQTLWELTSTHDGSRPSAKVRVVRGTLPGDLADDGWMVFSAGGSPGWPRISTVGRTILGDRKLSSDASSFSWDTKEFGFSIGQHRKDGRLWAVNARLDPFTKRGGLLRPTDPKDRPFNREARKRTAGGAVRRDLRLIAPVVARLHKAACKQGARHVHSMLLAAGKGRTFSPSYSLMQMLRGWMQNQTQLVAGNDDPLLTIYVTSEQVLNDLDSGRLDLASGLSSRQTRFWLDVRDSDGSTFSHLGTESGEYPLLSLLSTYDIHADDWALDVTPPPCLGWCNWSISAVRMWQETYGRPMTIERFGIFSGTTLTCSR